jgi:hypothetical protein
MENVQQNHRIRAAGNGDEDFLPARKQMASLNFRFRALEKSVHAVILHFLTRTASGSKNHCANRSR